MTERLTLHFTSLHLAQMVKRLSTMRETWVRSLGWEDSLEKEMATHSSTLAWRILWTEVPGGLQPMGLQKVGHEYAINFHFYPSLLELQCEDTQRWMNTGSSASLSSCLVEQQEE